jgi:hypothetical protein
MATVGTYIIALFGYGAALLTGLTTLRALRNAARAQSDDDRYHEVRVFFVGAALTIFIAVITRGLVGAF